MDGEAHRGADRTCEPCSDLSCAVMESKGHYAAPVIFCRARGYSSLRAFDGARIQNDGRFADQAALHERLSIAKLPFFWRPRSADSSSTARALICHARMASSTRASKRRTILSVDRSFAR